MYFSQFFTSIIHLLFSFILVVNRNKDAIYSTSNYSHYYLSIQNMLSVIRIILLLSRPPHEIIFYTFIKPIKCTPYQLINLAWLAMKQNHDCSNWNESWWAIKWVICCLALCCFDCRKIVFCVEDQFGLSISQAVCTKAMWLSLKTGDCF